MKIINKKFILGIGILTIVILLSVWFIAKIENSEIINTKMGDNFSIVLPSNPTTGYQWELEFDSNYIQLIDRKYTQISKLIGGGGETTFEFVASKPGKTKITFSYLRPWLKDKESPIETKVFKIRIQKTDIIPF